MRTVARVLSYRLEDEIHVVFGSVDAEFHSALELLVLIVYTRVDNVDECTLTRR